MPYSSVLDSGQTSPPPSGRERNIGMQAEEQSGSVRRGEISGFITRIRAGDEEAARELLQRYEAKVRLVVRRQLPKLLRSRFDSLDFLQSVWGSFFHRVRTGPTDIED